VNRINPEKLMKSKWTAVNPVNRQRHFIVTGVQINDEGFVVCCELEAVITRKAAQIDWCELKDASRWRMGWK
jgi:tryptophan-rich hypothetical protein